MNGGSLGNKSANSFSIFLFKSDILLVSDDSYSQLLTINHENKSFVVDI